MRLFLYEAKNEKHHKELGAYLRTLEEGLFVVTVKKNRPIRSLKANGYYHIILTLIATETGVNHEQLHEICKLKFNPEIINLPKGGHQTLGKNTATLDTKEFGAYINRVKQWARDEFNLNLPEPGDLDTMRRMEIENNYTRTFSGY